MDIRLTLKKDIGSRGLGPGLRRGGAAVFLALSVLLPGLAARAAEFEINASSFTTDGQVNMSSVTYYGGMPTTPASPSVTQLPSTPGGLYFDGTRYRVWDNPAGAWVSLTTGTVGGLLPWSELTGYPGACTGGQVVTGVGLALACATPIGTLSGGTGNYYGKWTGGAAMGIGNLVDNGASVTIIANSTLTVSGNAFSVGVSTFVVAGGNVGIGTTSPQGKLDMNSKTIVNVAAPVNATDAANKAYVDAATGMRQYYLSTTLVTAVNALTACAAGYHMAALWEILHLSTLKYNTSLGSTLADSGQGPPAAVSAFGWVRTGGPNNVTSAIGANCNAWTSTSGSDSGTLVYLNSTFWGSAGTNMSPWLATTLGCASVAPVWCVSN